MKLLRELLVETEEADMPLIYDIICAKLKAGQKIIFGDSEPGVEYRVHSLEPISTKEGFVAYLTWVEHLRGGPKGYTDSDGAPYKQAEMEKWRLSKVKDHWELET
jgi:hypothetical protein